MHSKKTARRFFLQQVALGAGTAAQPPGAKTQGKAKGASQPPSSPAKADEIPFPRVFTGRRLKMIAFPLGGIAAGSISLGGRGQLRDWEIFNRPDKGNSPDYCFASIWAQAKGRKSVARVLEARLAPPYEGESGLGSNNVPGLPRLESATFTGEYPFARIEFHDAKLPVKV